MPLFSLTRSPAWRQADGVLSVDTVLADEHDSIHGDSVRETIGTLGLEFDEGQILDVPGVAHALLDALACIQPARGAGMPREADTPLTLAAVYILDEHRTGDGAAMLNAALRAWHADAGGTSERIDNAPEATPPGARPRDTPNRRLARALADRLNTLLDERLAEVDCFTPFVDAGCIDALGEGRAGQERLASRLLLEAVFSNNLARMRDRRLAVVFKAVREHETAALCLSGGGIRSATFALGVVHGLARHKLLGKFDYLSTVSGGGFTGSWLSAWMHHASAEAVQGELRRPAGAKVQPEPEPVQHLRSYSHYLTPRVGFASADMWTLIATMLRNMLLNWLVLIPLIAAALLVPRFIVAVLRVGFHDGSWIPPESKNILLSTFLVEGVILGIAAVSFVHKHRGGDEPDLVTQRRGAASQAAFLTRCLLPLVAGSLILSTVWYLWWTWSSSAPLQVRLFGLGTFGGSVRPGNVNPNANLASAVESALQHARSSFAFIGLGMAVHLGGWVAARRPRGSYRNELIPVLGTGLLAGIATLIVAMAFVNRPEDLDRENLYATLAAPAFLGIILVGSLAFTGWTSRSSTDAEREWIARFNAWLLIVIVGWCVSSAIVIYGPEMITAAWQRAAVAGLGGLTGFVTVWIGRSTKTPVPGSPTSKPPGAAATARRLALALVAPVFTACLIIALAAANEGMIKMTCDYPQLAPFVGCRPVPVDSLDLTRSIPVQLLSADETRRVDSLSGLFASTHSDANLNHYFAAVAAGVDSIAAAPPGQLTAARPVALLQSLDSWAARTSALVAATIVADSAIRTRSAALTAASVSADSMAEHDAAGDTVLLADYERRLRDDASAALILAARFRLRDTLAQRSDSLVRHIAQTVDTVAMLSGDSVSDALHAAAGRLQAAWVRRVRSAVDAEHATHSDSVKRGKAHRKVLSALATRDDERPFDAAVPFTVIVLFCLLALLARTMGVRIDTNKFSLFGMYNARLVRAYLGASRPACDRNPNPFTGFDRGDDIPIGTLWPAAGAAHDVTGSARGRRGETSPPMHVVNVTLNLVAGQNLAWQQRKAESMTITPLHAGSLFVGYRRTSPPAATPDAAAPGTAAPGTAARGTAARDTAAMDDPAALYGGPLGVTLGTAMTISGAAASPNSGSHSSPLVTFLMTLFNARLGAWLGNPGMAGASTYGLAAPRQKIRPIVSEMLGETSDKSPYVYLSDGGHFENLGLYEMLLRRCRFILAVDAGCDQNCSFDDLGNAVRKARVDLGISIEFPKEFEIRPRNQSVPGHDSYWAVGRIGYSAIDGDASLGNPDDYDGIILYVKPAVYGDEPRDVFNYAQVSPTFPHESTTDQFFSESQFESYRKLGEHIIDKLVTRPTDTTEPAIAGKRDGSLLSLWPNLGGAGTDSPNASPGSTPRAGRIEAPVA